jgi:hypothetical protein
MARRARSIGAHLPIKNNTSVYTLCCYGFKRTVLFPGPVLDVAYANGPIQTDQRSCVCPTPACHHAKCHLCMSTLRFCLSSASQE